MRVIRAAPNGSKKKKHRGGEYLPKIGLRYDGIYKVVDYWREKGQVDERVVVIDVYVEWVVGLSLSFKTRR